MAEGAARDCFVVMGLDDSSSGRALPGTNALIVGEVLMVQGDCSLPLFWVYQDLSIYDVSMCSVRRRSGAGLETATFGTRDANSYLACRTYLLPAASPQLFLFLSPPMRSRLDASNFPSVSAMEESSITPAASSDHPPPVVSRKRRRATEACTFCRRRKVRRSRLRSNVSGH